MKQEQLKYTVTLTKTGPAAKAIKNVIVALDGPTEKEAAKFVGPDFAARSTHDQLVMILATRPEGLRIGGLKIV